jgi:hypothetical protein
MMYIIEVPEGTDVYTLDAEIQTAVLGVSGQWPEAIMPNTQAVDGRQVVLVYADADKATIEALILGAGLDWLILAAQGETVDQAALLPFYLPVTTYDASGNESGAEAVTDLTGKIQTFAGLQWDY